MKYSANFTSSPANGQWISPWLDAPDQSWQIASLSCGQSSTVFLDGSTDGSTVAATQQATGTAVNTPALPPFPFFRIRFTNGGVADPSPVSLSILPTSPINGAGLVRLSLPLAWNTPGIATGVKLPGYVPKIGDVLMRASVRNLAAWNGVTPKIDFSFNPLAGKTGVFGASGDPAWVPAVPDASFDGAFAQTGLFQAGAGLLDVNYALSEIYVQSTNGALTAWVTRDGTFGGAATGSNAGSSILDVWISPQATALV